MRKFTFILLCWIGAVFANAPIPSQSEQQQSWNNSVNSANSMNSNGVGNIGLTNYADVNAGLNFLSSQVGANTINYAKQSVDGNGQATAAVQSQFNGARTNQNYLYNQGRAGLIQCKSQSDPACAAVTKYNDDSVQGALHQYNMGTNSFAYNMYVTPDPSNATCSLIHTFQPVNSQTIQCTSGINSRQGCITTITPYSNYYPPSPPDGSIVSSGGTSVGACGGAHASSNAQVSVSEVLTNQGLIHFHVENDSSGHCGGGAPETYDNNLPTTGVQNLQIYRVDDPGCGNDGDKWDMGGWVSINGSCFGSFCSYTVSVSAHHGGGGGQCNETNTQTYNLNFNLQKPGWTDNGFTLNDQCSVYKN